MRPSPRPYSQHILRRTRSASRPLDSRIHALGPLPHRHRGQVRTWRKEIADRVHHVLSILVWPLASRNGPRARFFYAEYTELSSPFLQLRRVTQLFFGPKPGGQARAPLRIVVYRAARSTNVHVVLHAALVSRQYSLALHPELPLHVRLIGAVTARFSLC